MPLSKRVPTNKGAKRGTPVKKCYFTAIGLSNVKIVADRHRLLKNFKSMTLNDLDH